VSAFIDTNILSGTSPVIRRRWRPAPPLSTAAYLVACAESTGVGRVAFFDIPSQPERGGSPVADVRWLVIRE